MPVGSPEGWPLITASHLQRMNLAIPASGANGCAVSERAGRFGSCSKRSRFPSVLKRSICARMVKSQNGSFKRFAAAHLNWPPCQVPCLPRLASHPSLTAWPLPAFEAAKDHTCSHHRCWGARSHWPTSKARHQRRRAARSHWPSSHTERQGDEREGLVIKVIKAVARGRCQGGFCP